MALYSDTKMVIAGQNSTFVWDESVELTKNLFSATGSRSV